MAFFNPPQGLLPEEADEVDIKLGNLMTIEEWSQEPGMPVVIDPDGFDRTDPRLGERLFTEDEFMNGAMASTIFGVPDEYEFEDDEDFYESPVHHPDWE